MELVVRTGIGPYEMAAHLDSGGMADVYLAHGADPARLVVIKVLRPQHRGVAEIVDMFREEARVMRRLSHPNVVRVEDDGQEDGCPWIAMEYLDGDHLGTLLRAARRQRRPLSPSLVARLGLEVCRGLAYVHGLTSPDGRPMGLVHRDVSPQNVFLCYSGEVKLLDFGIAKAIDREEATRTGLLKGKIAYLSPEQVRHQPVDGRSDLFSLGIVMWELLTGRRLFKTSNEYDTMRRICEQPAPAVDGPRPDTPPELVTILGRLLQRSAGARYRCAEALAQALESFLSTQAASADEPARFVQTLLVQRRQQKAALVEAVRQEGDLQLRLFGDLVDSRDETGSEELSLAPDRPATGPDRIRARRMDPDIAKAPLDPDENTSEDAALDQDAVAPGPARTRTLGVWIGLGALVLVAIGLLTWFFAFRPGERASAPPAAVPARPGRSEPAQPAGVLATSKPLKRRSAKALVSILVDRKVAVALAGRDIGPAPVERLALRAGEHVVDLTASDPPVVKRMIIQAERGKHTIYRVTF